MLACSQLPYPTQQCLNVFFKPTPLLVKAIQTAPSFEKDDPFSLAMVAEKWAPEDIQVLVLEPVNIIINGKRDSVDATHPWMV